MNLGNWRRLGLASLLVAAAGMVGVSRPAEACGFRISLGCGWGGYRSFYGGGFGHCGWGGCYPRAYCAPVFYSRPYCGPIYRSFYYSAPLYNNYISYPSYYYPSSYYNYGYWLGQNAANDRFNPIDAQPELAGTEFGNGRSVDRDRNPQFATLPTTTPLNQDLEARGRELLVAGTRLFNAGSYRQAAERFAQAGNYLSSDATPHFFRAQAFFAQGDYAAATEAIRTGLKRDPQWADLNFDVRALYEREEVLQAQLGSLARTIQTRGATADTMVLLGYELFVTGKRDQAHVVLTKAADLTVEPGAVRTLLAWYDRNPAARTPAPVLAAEPGRLERDLLPVSSSTSDLLAADLPLSLPIR